MQTLKTIAVMLLIILTNSFITAPVSKAPDLTKISKKIVELRATNIAQVDRLVLESINLFRNFHKAYYNVNNILDSISINGVNTDLTGLMSKLDASMADLKIASRNAERFIEALTSIIDDKGALVEIKNKPLLWIRILKNLDVAKDAVVACVYYTKQLVKERIPEVTKSLFPAKKLLLAEETRKTNSPLFRFINTSGTSNP